MLLDIKEHLRANNSIEFNKVVRQALEERLVARAIRLTEGSFYSEPELRIVNRLQTVARGFGADTGTYVDGILEVHLRSKQATAQFAEVLDNDDDVENYEVDVRYNDRIKGYSDEIDFDSVIDDTNMTFVFFIELNPDVTTVVDQDNIEDYTVDVFSQPENAHGAWNPTPVGPMLWQPWMESANPVSPNMDQLVHSAGMKLKGGKQVELSSRDLAKTRIERYKKTVVGNRLDSMVKVSQLSKRSA